MDSYCYLIAYIFDKLRFIEMFHVYFSTKHIILIQTPQFDWLPWQPKV